LRQLAAKSIFTLFILFPYVCQSEYPFKCKKSLIAVVVVLRSKTKAVKQNNAIFDKEGPNIEIETFND
jgi:hypothetical protein